MSKKQLDPGVLAEGDKGTEPIPITLDINPHTQTFSLLVVSRGTDPSVDSSILEYDITTD
jgi:hypothetical protein